MSLDYCAHAFRYCATKFLGRTFPLQFHLDRAEIESDGERQIWDVYTPGSSFPGMPAMCRVIIFLTPDHALRAKQNHERVTIEKPDVLVLLASTWEREGFSAVITTDGQPRPEPVKEPALWQPDM
jgi:hypothetical protein